jgi:adenylate cyclase
MKKFLFFIFFTSNVFSDVILKDLQYEYPLNKDLFYLEDISNKLSFVDIRTIEKNKEFKTSDSETLNFGHTLSTYWFNFKVKNESSNSNWVFQMRFPLMDYFSIYIPDENGNYIEKKSGVFVPFYEREIQNRNYVFNIPISQGESKEIYIFVKTSGNLQMPASILSKEHFFKEDPNQKFLFGLYFGMMAVIAIYNLFLFFAVRDPSYFFYVIYIISFIFIQLGLSGLGVEYIWPNFSWMTLHYYPFFTGISILGVSLFNKYFLQTKLKFKKSNIFLNISIIVGIILILSTITLPAYQSIQLAVALVLLPILGSFVIAILALIKGFSPARYFLIAFSVLLLSIIIILFRSINLLQTSFLTEYGMYIGSALEVLLLSFALADRINILKKEKEIAQKNALLLQEQLTESYARFVPKEFLLNLQKSSILDVKLGDQVSKEMSIMFADIRSFTTLSEQMSPEENFNFINSYLKRMSPIIQKHSGYIDKFMGDGIMALFDGNPENSLEAAIDMQNYLLEYNMFRAKQNYSPISIGIGVHTGRLMLGAVGGENRMEGTVISDTVNLASRIEGLTKHYKIKIATSGDTLKNLSNKDKFSTRYLGKIKVVGKKEAVSVFEVFDSDDPKIFELKNKTISEFNNGVQFFYQKKFDISKTYFEEVLKVNSEDNTAKVFIEKFKYISQEWDGIEELKEK